MSQNKYLDSAGLTFYDRKIKDWFKTEIVDIVEDAIKELFPIPDNPYVTFTALEDNSSIGLVKLSINQTLEYSIDTTIWNKFDTTTNISLNNGDKVHIRGMLGADNSYLDSDYTQFKMTGKIAASGNCNALWNYEDLNAPLKNSCGYYMFRGCTSLTTAPELPATTLAPYCYQSMFSGCTKLSTAPELPATTLAQCCYNGMFYNCASLTAAPELPATTLAERCYGGMFQTCTSLTAAPELPATTLSNSCYNYMFYRCTALTTAPVLPATTLVYRCYECMFSRCTNLNHITCLATDIPTDIGCLYCWVDRVASTGTFVKHPDMSTWIRGISGIPSGWTVVDAEL